MEGQMKEGQTSEGRDRHPNISIIPDLHVFKKNVSFFFLS